MNNKNKNLGLALIWFGAAVALPEIITGTYFAPLGFFKGISAVIIGHLIGCLLLFGSGYIGSVTQKSAMNTAKMSFGSIGGRFFALLNVIQLLGWTEIMIRDGSLSANEIFGSGEPFWAILIGALIILWLLLGAKGVSILNIVSVLALFALTLVLSRVIFSGRSEISVAFSSEEITFGSAVELSVAMPLSWLPLIGDYTRESDKPFSAAGISAGIYYITSCWMYIIGMASSLLTGETNITLILLKTSLGFASLAIVILSTVTTTFLDSHSAGVSFEAIFSNAKGKIVAIVVAVVGTIGSVLLPERDITDFLYLIGSVFAPMIAIELADFIILKNNSQGKKLDIVRVIIWIFGFIFYQLSLGWNFVLGNTLPVMLTVFAVTSVVGLILRRKKGE